MTADRAETRWMRWGAPLAMAVVVLAPLPWVLRVADRPTALVIVAVAVLAVVVSGRVPEERWLARLVPALVAAIVAERLAGGLAGVWVLVAVVLCDWAIRGRRPLPVVPAGEPLAVVPVAALSLGAAWLAGTEGSAVRILVLLGAAVLLIPVSARVQPSPDRPGAELLRSAPGRGLVALRSAGSQITTAIRDRQSRWGVAMAAAALWAIANLVWFEVHRGARLWDHEEVTYARLVSYFASGSGGEPFAGLFVAHYGPMQALLGAPFQWVFGVNEATVFYVNIGLTGVTGLLVFWMVSRLADPSAGLVAGALTLLTPGMLENARGALTMVPATTFAAVALAALVMGGGLRRWQWAAVAGIAMGCMSLSRPMSIAFIPGLAVPAIVWSVRAATPWRTIMRNGALAGVAAVGVSLWWWVISLPRVMDYLSTGAEGVATGSVAEVLDSRLYELSAYIGPIASPDTLGYTWYAAAGAFAVLFVLGRRRTRAVAVDEAVVQMPPTRTVDDPQVASALPEGVKVPEGLPLWPVWAAVAVDVAVSLTSNTIGWLMLPVVPWMIVATVAGVRRALQTWAWRSWAVVVVVPVAVVALWTSTVSVTPGNRFTWCIEPWQKTSACAIEDRAQAAEWKAAIRRITDEALASRAALLDAGRERAQVAVVARDHILLPPIFRFQAWVDHRRGIDDATFTEDHFVILGDLEHVRDEAGVVVVSPDLEQFQLFPRMIDPDELPPYLLESGFAVCDEVELPDGRVVQTFVRTPLPTGACA